MPVNATARKIFTDLIKAESNFEDENGVDFKYATVGVEGTGSIDNIGIPLLWDDVTVAFGVLAAPADWAATTVYAVGDVRKPAVRDGNEYVCTVAGTSLAAEPTFNLVEGGETVEAAGPTWTTRAAYSGRDEQSTLPNKSRIAVTVGGALGKGFNTKDVALSATPANMRVIFRGDAALTNAGMIWGSVAAADQAEFLAALEASGITSVTNATVVTPTFTS